MAEPAHRGIRLIGRRVGQWRRRLPRKSVGSIHGRAMTTRGAQAGGPGVAGEIISVTWLAGAETGHVRGTRRGLCCSAVGGGSSPTGSMADLNVAKCIVKAIR